MICLDDDDDSDDDDDYDGISFSCGFLWVLKRGIWGGGGGAVYMCRRDAKKQWSSAAQHAHMKNAQFLYACKVRARAGIGCHHRGQNRRRRKQRARALASLVSLYGRPRHTSVRA
jgi:hypothetical protein